MLVIKLVNIMLVITLVNIMLVIKLVNIMLVIKLVNNVGYKVGQYNVGYKVGQYHVGYEYLKRVWYFFQPRYIRSLHILYSYRMRQSLILQFIARGKWYLTISNGA